MLFLGFNIGSNTPSVSASAVPSGAIFQYGGPITNVPSGYLGCVGTAVSRTTYPDLFAALVTNLGACTVNTSTGQITLNNHGLINGDVVFLETTGVLPGFNTDLSYQVTSATQNSFYLSQIIGLVYTDVTGILSGTATVFHAPYGVANASTFNLPDGRSRIPIGSGSGIGLSIRNLGQVGGEENHLLTATESGIASHTHNANVNAGETFLMSGVTNEMADQGTGTQYLGTSQTTGDVTGGTVSAASSHNNMPPFFATNFIIKI